MLTDTEIDGIVRAIQELRDEVAALRRAVEASAKPKKKRTATQAADEPESRVAKVREFVALWNTTTAGKLPVAAMPGTGSQRFKAIVSALEWKPDLEAWKGAMAELSRSSFHTGNNERGWSATIDFIIGQSQREKWIDFAKWRAARVALFASPVPSESCSKCAAVAVVGPGTRSPDLSKESLCRECFVS